LTLVASNELSCTEAQGGNEPGVTSHSVADAGFLESTGYLR
jgi:hypothetical protein